MRSWSTILMTEIGTLKRRAAIAVIRSNDPSGEYPGCRNAVPRPCAVARQPGMIAADAFKRAAFLSYR